MRSLSLRPTALLTSLVAIASLGLGCSLINAPDDIIEGSGGNATTTSTNTGTGGMAPTCTVPADCTELTTECATGDCVQGSCVAEPQPAGLACGAAPTGSCDLANTCDGTGNCSDNVVPNGTFCGDCAAGPGNCGLCADGACPDCSTRATSKTFRSPLASSGWTMTGDWRIYTEAPPGQVFYPKNPHECSDGIDNDGDTLIDFPADPNCQSADDPFENNFPQCSNGFDDDQDGLIDLLDPDCESATDDIEAGPIPFDHGVLGTNGNRTNTYFVGGEKEVSSTTSPPTLLPSTLSFLSWHIDEGDAYDLKAVQVSLDGVSFTSIAICVQGGGAPYPFCPFRTTRAADDWDVVDLPVPGQFAGQVGYVRFLYDTTDSCCGFERGWYVDALNFATDCACGDASQCGFLDSGCANGACDPVSAECYPEAANTGSNCTLAGTTGDCSAPSCNSYGLCGFDQAGTDTDNCADCSEGAGLCEQCSAGACLDCPEVQDFINFTQPPSWVFTGDWSPYGGCLPPNFVTPNDSLCFYPPMGIFDGDPKVPNFLANDGSRTGAFPWTNAAKEIEVGLAQLGPAILPATLNFNSWHQDRGGNNTFTPRDTKLIRVSTDGSNWTTLIDCDGNMTVPFCQPWATTNVNRTIENWDAVSFPVPAAMAGQMGFIEISYNTVDAGVGWERGWLIDDINFERCR